jgi:hypothetical protein
MDKWTEIIQVILFVAAVIGGMVILSHAMADMVITAENHVFEGVYINGITK